jgi:hypothetical protein
MAPRRPGGTPPRRGLITQGPPPCASATTPSSA